MTTTEGRMPHSDDALARLAAAGDAEAFATLYDRYERRVYNLCYRITGSPDDAADATQETFLKVLERLPRLEERELNFGAYLMTAARNASYDALERRKRSAPSGDIPDSAVPLGAGEDPDLPERSALREAHQEQIRVANLALPPRQREVLALRELEDLSYGEVAQIMGMNQNSVAQLISRARINLRDGLRATALGSVASASPQCDRALPLLASYQDGVLEDPWLAEHLMSCGACRVRLEAMEEAAVAYRQWLLLVPALWLREETAEAAERVSQRGRWLRRRLPVAAGVTAVVLLALAFLAADGAESPTRAFAPAPTPAATPEPEPVLRVAAAPKPVKPRRVSRPRPRKVARAHEPKVVETAPRPVLAAAPVTAAPVAAAPAPAAPRKRVRPRRDPRPVAEPVEVAADPPAVVEEPPPAPVDEPPVTPDPPADPPPTPPCLNTRAGGCPPPRPVVVVCTSCPLVAPTPQPQRATLKP